MPNTKSAIRRVKKTFKQNSVNKIRKSKYKSAVKQMAGYISSGKMKEAQKDMKSMRTQQRTKNL